MRQQETSRPSPARTPEEFVEMLDRALDALAAAALSAKRGEGDAGRLAEEAKVLATRVTGSPFEMSRGNVIPKGFTPRVV